jgi:Holliday junction DNA helicase RuvA
MIGSVSGVILQKQPGLVVIECAGVGYEVEVSMNTFCELPNVGEAFRLWTHLVVREDAQLLFGFASEQERSTFRTLIKISGVGARTALSILSGIAHHDLAMAVVQQDISRLIKVPGVGKKTAERLLLELKGKFKNDVLGSSVAGETDVQKSVAEALMSLGYSEKDVIPILKKMPQDLDLSQALRWALQQMS